MRWQKWKIGRFSNCDNGVTSTSWQHGRCYSYCLCANDPDWVAILMAVFGVLAVPEMSKAP